MSFSDSLKKITLAAIGAGAITCEKTSEIVGHLVEKGESTVEQGKAANTELRHNVKETVTRQKAIVKEAADKAKADAQARRSAKGTILDATPEEIVDDAAKAAKDIIEVVSKLSAEQLDAVKKVLDAVETTADKKEDAPAEEEPAAEEAAEEFTAEAEEILEEAAVEAPVEEAPVEEAPAEEAPVEELSAEEVYVGEASAEEAPVEEIPAE